MEPLELQTLVLVAAEAEADRPVTAAPAS